MCKTLGRKKPSGSLGCRLDVLVKVTELVLVTLEVVKVLEVLVTSNLA